MAIPNIYDLTKASGEKLDAINTKLDILISTGVTVDQTAVLTAVADVKTTADAILIELNPTV